MATGRRQCIRGPQFALPCPDQFVDPELDWDEKSEELLDFLTGGFTGGAAHSTTSGSE